MWRAYVDEYDLDKWWVENTETHWRTSAEQNWAIRVLPSDDEQRAKAYAEALESVDARLRSAP